eukprot:TRINITY_DN30688_c0_g1_i1.p1 TRINITY_DN30688_c0_g1~~TRINITY_DN30688_c0_g1_i1.p1  ORF type:complete len:861 (+),score=232.87 TRINITY_DN30688_c0_g1_i1:80-2662(+)
MLVGVVSAETSPRSLRLSVTGRPWPGGDPRREQAATTLQASWRGRQARKEVAALRRRLYSHRSTDPALADTVAQLPRDSAAESSAGSVSRMSSLLGHDIEAMLRGLPTDSQIVSGINTEATPRRDEFQLSHAQWLRIQDTFRTMDDGSGTLGRAEITHLLAVLFPTRSPLEVAEYAHALLGFADELDGTVSLVEFLDFVDPGFVPGGERMEDEEVEMLQLVQANTIQLEPPENLRAWLWALLNVEEAQRFLTEDDWLIHWATRIQVFSQLVIAVSIGNIMVESEPQITLDRRSQGYSHPVFIVEAVTIALFTIELLLRFASAPNKRAFCTDSFTLIDVLSVVPFFLTELGLRGDQAKGLAALRVIRLTRLLRIIKVGRHSVGIYLLAMSVRQALLPLLWLTFVILLFVILSGAIMWQIETASNARLLSSEEARAAGYLTGAGWYRDANSTFEEDRGQKIAIKNIMEAMWWSAVTLTATGYGTPYVPYTRFGKAWGAITIFFSIVFLAFPATILTQRFCVVYADYELRRQIEEKAQRTRKRLLLTHFGRRRTNLLTRTQRVVHNMFLSLRRKLTSSDSESDLPPAAPPESLLPPPPPPQRTRSKLDELRRKASMRSTAIQRLSVTSFARQSIDIGVDEPTPRTAPSTEPSRRSLTSTGDGSSRTSGSSYGQHRAGNSARVSVRSPGGQHPSPPPSPLPRSSWTPSAASAASHGPAPSVVSPSSDGSAKTPGLAQRSAPGRKHVLVDTAPSEDAVETLQSCGSSASLDRRSSNRSLRALPPRPAKLSLGRSSPVSGEPGSFHRELSSFVSSLYSEGAQLQSDRAEMASVVDTLLASVRSLEQYISDTPVTEDPLMLSPMAGH